MIRLLIFFILILSSINLPASSKDSLSFSKYYIFGEVLGHGESFFSINFEYSYCRYFKFPISIRSGIGYIPKLESQGIIHKAGYSIPFVGSLYFHNGSTNNIFVRAGYSVLFGSNWTDTTTFPVTHHYKFEPISSFSIGYRYYNKHGTTFDIYPMIRRNIKSSNKFYFWLGFAIGWGGNSFKR